ncbi:kh domain-containing protein [Cyclospora cayetanensis]|uniref:Kh domain-containing protein n=1 Tax=Cyclospora cayetanensis TaxID=88456 RepID=A0A1D3D7M1_9EIME|nr:kh domain-containing protein [Cyclospora cayetanensis]
MAGTGETSSSLASRSVDGKKENSRSKGECEETGAKQKSSGDGHETSTARERSRSKDCHKHSSHSRRKSENEGSRNGGKGDKDPRGQKRSYSHRTQDDPTRERSHSIHKKQKKESSPSVQRPRIINTTDPTKNTLGDPFPPDLEGPCYVKLLPQQRDVSILLGVDNRGLANLAKSHGCKSRLSAKDVFFPQTNRRMLLLQGTVDAIHRMTRQALQTISEPGKHRDSARSCSVTFIAPHDACVLVPEGSDQPLRKLRKVGKAKLTISDRKDMKKQGGRERLLTLEGGLPDVQEAACKMVTLLQQIADLRDYTNLKYDSCMPKEKKEEEEAVDDLLGEELDESTMQALASILIPPKEEPVKAGVASVAPNIPNLSDSAKAALISQAQDELARISNMRYMRDNRHVLLQGPAYHKVLVSDLVAAQLLGSSGNIINQFEAEYAVQVKIAPPEPPPCTERIVIISGQPQDADRALLAVLEKVYAACLMVGHANFMVWRMCAMSTCCAFICGPGGQRIRQLASFTGTRIQISNRDQQTPSHHAAQLVPSNPHERIISILGPLEQVTIAIKAMLPYIHADPNQSLSVHQTYGHGYKLKMPAWAETGVLQEGMNMEALNEDPLEDERPISLPGPSHIKLLIDPALANSLIGKESATITTVSKECGCSMHVLSSKNKFPDSTDRILLMSGPAESISNGVIALLERCKEVHPNLPYDQMYAKLVVPISVCASVIGPGGTRVRELREATLTRITIDRSTNPCSERIIAVHGMAQGVHQAVVAINTIAQTDPSLVLMLELQYDYLEQQDSQQQNAQVDSNIVGAVLQGVLSVSNKVGGGAAETAVKRLESLKQATAAQGQLGPMGQLKSGHTFNYDAPVSFVTASSSPPVASEASKSFALAQRAAQALGDDPRVRPPSPPRQEEWEHQQREIERYEQQRVAGQAHGIAETALPPPSGPSSVQQNYLRQAPANAVQQQNGMDEDDDPLLEGLMNEAF